MERSFRCRRALLAELRLLQPKRYAEMAVDALGLLNRSIQERCPAPYMAERGKNDGERFQDQGPKGMVFGDFLGISKSKVHIDAE